MTDPAARPSTGPDLVPLADLPARVGDVVVLLGAAIDTDLGSLPVRCATGSWAIVGEGSGWRLAATPPGPGWAGYEARALPGGGVLLGSTGPDPLPGCTDELARRAGGLRGSWLALAPVGTGRAWSVWTDRFGTVHGYRCGTAVGTFSPAVATAGGSRRGLDWAALTAWSAFGFFPGTATQFDDVAILAPAHRHEVWSEGPGGRSTATWEWAHDPRPASSADAADSLGRGLAASLAVHITGDRLAVPISGGLDSRSTVAALSPPGGPPPPGAWSYSYGWGPRSIELSIGRRIAEARGFRHDEWVVGPYLLDDLDRAVDVVEGFQDLTQSRQLSVIDRVAAEADQVVAAHWGDVWLDDAHWHGPADPGPGALADALLRAIRKPGGAWLVEHLCRPHLDGDPEQLLRQSVLDGLAGQPPVADPDMALKAWKTRHWSFRWTLASIRAYRAGLDPVLPFYDPVLTDQLLTLPTALVAGRHLQIEYLKRSAPDLARITWQAQGTSLFGLDRPHAVRRAGHLARAARRRLRPDHTPARNWEVQLAGPRAGRVRDLLTDPAGGLAGLIEPAAVASLCDRLATRPDREVGYAVSMLVTLAAWRSRHG